MKYRKKPVIIDAVQWNGQNVEEIKNFMDISSFKFIYSTNEKYPKLVIHTLEGEMSADISDYIIKGVKGEFYPCKFDIFAQTYDVAIDAPSIPSILSMEVDRVVSWLNEHKGFVIDDDVIESVKKL